MTLNFAIDGTARCLYDEAIDLRTLGTLSIERASTVEFDETSQCWQVRLPDGAPVFAHESREVCLAWEREHLA